LLSVALAVLADPMVAGRAAARDLAGLTVAVSAGGTREHLDPVRFLGNSSSGLMGWAVARAAALRGASVRLVAANVATPPPLNTAAQSVTSTADFTPAAPSATKIKKSGDSGLQLELQQTADVLAGLVAARTDDRQVLVGFAAETPNGDQSLVDLGRAKLQRKGCDLLVLNEVGPGLVFGRPDNEITLITGDGVRGPIGGSKDTLAHHILDATLTMRSSQ
jgi:phosphopantothenoylcysteine decarboxylase/phosphopantothenate--cysteine ligase